ncbi:MAG TPA: hypothetical protein VGB30_13455, partial [bacterium]
MPNQPEQIKSRRNRNIDWWLVAVLAIPIAYFLPEVLGMNVFAGIDTSRLNMPLRYFDREALASGAFPLWNPYIYAGFPNFAESESGFLYPGNIFIHMPGDFFHWYSIQVVAHFMIAGLGFYLWMQLRGISKPVSAFLAATYCTTPFLVFHITAFGLFTSIVWLPWYFYIYEHGLRSKHPWKVGLWFGLFLSIMLISGSVQAAWLGFMGVFLFALISVPASEDKKTAFAKSAAIFIPAIFAPFIAAIQLLPTYELTLYSERAANTSLSFFEMGTWLNIPRLISLVIFPALDNAEDIQHYGSSLCFFGVIPFIFAFVGLSTWNENKKILLPSIIAGIICLFLGFGLNLPGYSVLVEFPPFSMFRYAGRSAHVAFTLFLPVAGYGIDLLIKNRKINESKSSVMTLLAGAGLCLLAILIGFLTLPSSLQFGVFVSLVIIFLLSFILSPIALGKFPHAKINSTLAIFLALSFLAQAVLTYPFSRVLVQKRPDFDKSLQFFADIKSEFPTDIEIPRVIMPGSHYLLDPDVLSHLGFSAQTDIWDSMSGNAAGLMGVTSLRGLTPLNQQKWKEIIRDTLQANIDAELARSRLDGDNPAADDISLKIFRLLGADVLLLEGDNWIVDGYELWRTNLELPFHDGLCAYRAVDGWVPDAILAESVDYKDGMDYAKILQWLGSVDVDTSTDVFLNWTEAGYFRGPEGAEGKINARDRGFNWYSFDISIEGANQGFLVTGENYLPGW